MYISWSTDNYNLTYDYVFIGFNELFLLRSTSSSFLTILGALHLCFSVDHNAFKFCNSCLLDDQVERALTQSQSTIVIMDAPNYIKGYRYELYCMAKSHKHQQIVLFSDIPPEISEHWNSKVNFNYSCSLLCSSICLLLSLLLFRYDSQSFKRSLQKSWSCHTM